MGYKTYEEIIGMLDQMKDEDTIRRHDEETPTPTPTPSSKNSKASQPIAPPKKRRRLVPTINLSQLICKKKLSEGERVKYIRKKEESRPILKWRVTGDLHKFHQCRVAVKRISKSSEQRVVWKKIVCLKTTDYWITGDVLLYFLKIIWVVSDKEDSKGLTALNKDVGFAENSAQRLKSLHQNYRGFHTVMLHRGRKPISVASFRVRDSEMAEVPLMCTQDAYTEDPSNGPINSVQFHRNAQVLLAAGLDKKLRFFQVDGNRNTKIQMDLVCNGYALAVEKLAFQLLELISLSLILPAKSRSLATYGINATCTHLGCVVPLNAAEKKFICPCHGSQYNYQGKVVRGPAPLSLALAHADIDDGKVVFVPWVETDFRTGLYFHQGSLRVGPRWQRQRQCIRNASGLQVVWSSEYANIKQDGYGYIWLPVPSQGYVPVGYMVSCFSNKSSLDQISCVRSDLSDACKCKVRCDSGEGAVLVAADLLGEKVVAPAWLGYAREWGPKISFDLDHEFTRSRVCLQAS
ncbi:hypothetical protein ACLOJK_003456 [Asimina triloba]